MVDVGVNAVFGPGPHFVRGVQLRHGVPIVYSARHSPAATRSRRPARSAGARG
ncbi:MAG: CapA family protein [Solirubrobacterales bacterium]|nr:CapA family protein [Solirubrobacterales bacterium]